MQDDLVERVAWDLVTDEPDGVCIGPRHYRIARSIIRIVLEEAAKVANDRSKYFDYVNIQGDKYTAGSPYDRGAEKASQDIEAAIRAKMESLT